MTTIAVSDKGHCCGNCRFFREEGQQCRKNPPLGHILMLQRQNLAGQAELEPRPIGYWPIVNKTNWCGEWAPASAEASN